MDMAKRAEKAALSFDPRITNSEGASFDTYLGHRVFANSRGFAGEYRSSSCSISAVPVAKQGDAMERDYWFHLRRSFAGLEKPEDVGRIAAERACADSGAVKVETQRVPVIFEPRTARSILGNIFDAIEGRSIYRQSSFLAGKLGEQVAAKNITVIDDGTLPGLFGTTPFDAEGLPTRRTVVIEKGILKNYLLNTYSARKLNMKSTGNASRGVTGNAGVGHGNFFLQAGREKPTGIDCFRSEWFLCDGVNRLRREHRYRRLLAGRGRTLDTQWRTRVCRFRSDHCQHIAANADESGSRLGPGVSWFHCIADTAGTGDDRRWAVAKFLFWPCC